jgi:hypothetical protein
MDDGASYAVANSTSVEIWGMNVHATLRDT